MRQKIDSSDVKVLFGILVFTLVCMGFDLSDAMGWEW